MVGKRLYFIFSKIRKFKRNIKERARNMVRKLWP